MCFTLHSTVGALLMFHKPNTKKERKKEKCSKNTQYSLILKNDIWSLKLQPQNDCAEIHFTHL